MNTPYQLAANRLHYWSRPLLLMIPEFFCGWLNKVQLPLCVKSLLHPQGTLAESFSWDRGYGVTLTCLLAQNTQKTSILQWMSVSQDLMTCIFYPCLLRWSFSAGISTPLRKALRRKYNLAEDYNDWRIHAYCNSCALCQVLWALTTLTPGLFCNCIHIYAYTSFVHLHEVVLTGLREMTCHISEHSESRCSVAWVAVVSSSMLKSINAIQICCSKHLQHFPRGQCPSTSRLIYKLFKLQEWARIV